MTPEQEVEQEVLSYGFAAGFEAFLQKERLFEIEEQKAIRADWIAFVRSFGITMFCGGIFWGVVIWRFFR